MPTKSPACRSQGSGDARRALRQRPDVRAAEAKLQARRFQAILLSVGRRPGPLVEGRHRKLD